MLIVGIVALIEALSHKPCPTGSPSSACAVPGHLEPTNYHLLLKGAALLLILGAVLVISGVAPRIVED